MDYYDIIGVPPSASAEEIKNAYKQQVKFFHPDLKNVSKEVAEIKTRQLNEAYDILKDPEKRRVYDALRKLKEEGKLNNPAPPPPDQKTGAYRKRGRRQPRANGILANKATFWLTAFVLTAVFFLVLLSLMRDISIKVIPPSAQNVVLTSSPSVKVSAPPGLSKRTIRGRDENTIVYVSGGRIHLDENCSGMTKYTLMTLGQAYDRGFAFCELCFN